MNRSSSDDAARQRIVQDLDTTFLVEAGAGSGKTRKLVDRISALLALGKTEVGRIAAVTFTRKAAAELRERLQQRLEEKAAKDPDASVKERIRRAAADIGQAFVGTIHSFCARMLRERPVECGLDPDFTELEEAEAGSFLQVWWQDYLAAAHLRGDPALKRLNGIGIEAGDLEELYQQLCQFRDVEPDVPACPKPDLGAARRELNRFMATVRRAMPASEPEGAWDGLQSAYRHAQFLLDSFRDGRDKDLIDILELFEKPKVTLNRWPDKGDAYRLRDEILPRFTSDVVVPVVRGWREHIYPDCIGFARAAAAYAADRRSTESTLDYTDLLIKARDLLRDNAEVRRFFARRFTHILVDEFQDTDPIQCEILFYLAGDPPRSDSPKQRADWRAFRLRPGALFVVGDPKQSIYRFRRADIAAYNIVKELVKKSGGEVLTLSANFRSMNSIGAFVDDVFVRVFPTDATEHQAAFVPLATQKVDSGGLSGVRKLIVEGASTKAEIFDRSSELVASWVRWALKGRVQVEDEGKLRPARPDDILILTWQRDSLLAIAAALEARQVPFDITGSRGTFSAPEVGNILRLLNSLSDPDNPVAVVGVLVSPLFGHSYQDLWDFKKAGGSFRFLGAEQVDGSSAKHSISASLVKIETWWRLTLDRSPAAAIASIIEQTGLVPLSAASPLGATSAGRLFQMVEMARRAEEFGNADFPSAVEWLNGAIEADIEPLSILAGRRELVRVMNLHRAKGLEAPIVILAVPYKWDNKSVSSHIDRFGQREPTGCFLVTKPFGEYGSKVVAQPPDWEQKQAEELQYKKAEESRLLYVAATRAKQLLIVSDAPQIARGVNPWAGLLAGTVQELPMDRIDTTIQERRKVKVKAGAWVHDLQTLNDGLAALALGQYRQSSATELSKPAAGAPSAVHGLGPEYGSVVHRCLEWMANGREPGKGDIEQMSVEFELNPAPVDEILAELQKVKQTELWRRAMAASERHTEVPFSLFLDGTEIRQQPGPILVSGVIDLAFKERDRWCVVDYKTDRIIGDAKPYVEFYSGQLQLYAKAWTKLSGQAPSELLLLFTDPCTAHLVN